MRVRRKTLWGKIDKKGELQAYMGEVEAFLKMHPDKNVLIRYEIQPISPSQKMTNYFFGYIVKTLQRAIYDADSSLTERQTYDLIRDNCPVFLEEKRENGEWKVRRKDWEELDSAEAVEAIAFIQQWAAENYYCILDDAE